MAIDNGTTDRRRASRHPAQHEAHLLFVASLPAAATQAPPPALIGQTRDISLTGLSLIADVEQPSHYDLYYVGCLLQIKVSLPSGVVEVEGRVARREWINVVGRRENCLLGVSIIRMSGEDQARYSSYLRALEQEA